MSSASAFFSSSSRSMRSTKALRCPALTSAVPVAAVVLAMSSMAVPRALVETRRRAMPPAAESRQDRRRAPLVDECGDPMDLNVLDLMSLRRGHFRYESGYHGEIWLDLDRLFFDPRRLAPFVG